MTTRPSPRAASVLAAVACLVALSLVGGACSPLPPPPVGASRDAANRRPIVIVHGWELFCGSEDLNVWRTWSRAARERGRGADEISVFSYETCEPSAVSIDRLGAFVDDVLERTGAAKVDIVAHSLGSLIARACVRFGRCAGKVDKFASIAGANHGTIWANVCELAVWSRSTCDMKPDGRFLAGLNEGDETWGDVDYVTMISWCDLTIVPFTGAALDGALNFVTDRCLSHTDWRRDRVAADWVLDWFAGAAPVPQKPVGTNAPTVAPE